MQENVADQVNNCLIYFYDGYVYEIYAPEGSTFYPGDGFKLIQVDNLRFEKLTEALYRVECSFGDRTDEVMFYVSSGH
jgi:hypothetical protein